MLINHHYDVELLKDNDIPDLLLQFCVWGIFDGHIIAYARKRGFKATYLPEATETEKKKRMKKDGITKILNGERPRLFKLTPFDSHDEEDYFYVLTVFPGCDYIYQISRMVHQVMEMMTRGSAKTLLEIRRFVDLENHLAKWTGLEHVPIQEGDIVVLGHVNDYIHFMNSEKKEEGKMSFASLPSPLNCKMEARPSYIQLQERERVLDMDTILLFEND